MMMLHRLRRDATPRGIDPDIAAVPEPSGWRWDAPQSELVAGEIDSVERAETQMPTVTVAGAARSGLAHCTFFKSGVELYWQAAGPGGPTLDDIKRLGLGLVHRGRRGRPAA